MDFCSIDWDIIGKFFPSVFTSLFAFFIFSQWKNQKGSEVIANEAKSLIIKLAKLQTLQSDIFSILNESNGSNFPEDLFTEFKKTKNDFNDSINFLGFALSHDRSLSELPSIVASQALLFIRDIEKYKLGEISLNAKFFHSINPNDASNLTQLLLGYAMYQKIMSQRWSKK